MKSDNFSYSRMEQMEKCPLAYKFKYDEKINPFTPSIATEFGNMIHTCEEDIANAIINNEQINYAKIKNNFTAKLYRLGYDYKIPFNEVDKSGRTYKQKADDYLNNGIYRLEKFMHDHPSYKLIGAEVSFSDIQIGDQKFGGKIDRVLYDTATDTYICHDIKSWPDIESHESELTTPLQFVTYAIAMESLYNTDRNSVQCFYDLPCCNLIRSAGTKGFVERGIKKLNDLYRKIENKEYKPNVNPLCNWCPFSRTNPDAKAPFKYLCPYTCAWHRDTRQKADMFKTDFNFTTIEEFPIMLESYCNKYNVEFKTLDDFKAEFKRLKDIDKSKKGNEVTK